MGKSFPCSVCSKSVRVNQKGLRCTQCRKWVHISCDGVSVKLYNDNAEKFLNWKCRKCTMKLMPFYSELEIKPAVLNDYKRKPTCNISRTSENEGYNEIAKFSKNGFNCAHLNVVSLLKNFDEIKSLLCNNNIHIFALNESRLDSTVHDFEITVDNYKLIRKDRNRQGGGVAIYIHESLKFKQVTHPTIDNLEAILLLVDMNKSRPLLFVNWYRPPNSTRETLSQYEDMLTFIQGILMGDLT